MVTSLADHVVDTGYGRLWAVQLDDGRLGFTGQVTVAPGESPAEVTVSVDVLVVCADDLADIRPAGGAGVHVRDAATLPEEISAAVRTAVVAYLHSAPANELLLDHLRNILDDVNTLIARHGDDRSGHARAYRGEAMYRAASLLTANPEVLEVVDRMANEWQRSPEELIESAQQILHRQGFQQGYQEAAASYAIALLTDRYGNADPELVDALRQHTIEQITALIGNAANAEELAAAL
ncbi:hypothetical protein AB0F81_20200 [Actinoplanes sp. NPDC024001]|uniref:hypothetical protein n=1 Tax=unclassified Actinoplanes TaxID=2626549 RepID=UPI002E2403AC